MNLSAFKTYDIRGIYPSEVDEELAYKVGKSLVKYLNAKTLAVGRDMRQSSPSLHKYMLAGITSEGCKVLDIGMCTTPMLNYTVASKGLDGGVMITASHNPKEYNAFKVTKSHALMIHKDSGLLEIKKLVEGIHDFNKSKVKVETTLVNSVSILGEYTDYLTKKFEDVDFSNLKVSVDFSNGVGSISAIPVYENLRISANYLFEEPDGTFPNHGSDTSKHENFQELVKLVKDTKSDIGIFFDGDSDRCSFVDELGNIVNADITFCIMVDHFIDSYEDKRVYYDLRFSKVIVDTVEEHGGKATKLRVGNPFYKEKLIGEGGAMASEFSGHTMFSENFGIDDGLYASLKLLQVLAENGKTLSNLIKKHTVYASSPEINTHLKDGTNPDVVIEELKIKYSDGKQDSLDGLTVEYDNWWFNLRKSNTEPVVRLRLEADTQDVLEEKKAELVKAIEKYT